MSSIIEIKAPTPLPPENVRLSRRDRLSMAQVSAERGVQKCLLQHFVTNILNTIDAMRNILQRDYKPIEMQHVIFEWSMTHFQRRMQPDFNYIDAVLRKEDPDNLIISKLLIDLQNLRHHLQLIIEGQVDAAYVSLLGCRTLLYIRDELDHQLAENTEVVNGLAKQNFNADMLTLRTNQEQDDILHETMDRCADESLVSMPIYFRFELNYHRAEFDILEHSLLQREEMLERTNLQYYDSIKLNDYAVSSVMDHHNGRIQNFKTEIKYWSQKYEEEFYELVDKGTLLQLRLKALEQDWQESRERIEFYRAELKRIKEEELHEKKMKEELLAAEAEAEALRRQAEKKDKRKSKSQKK